jgi:hypothetical protein
MAVCAALAACEATAPAPRDLASGADFSSSSDASAADLAPARRGFPLLGMHTGAVLKPMTLVTVVAQNDALAGELATFGDHLVSSAWWQAAAQPFDVGAATSVHATGPAITSDQTQDQMIAYLQSVIAAGAPAPNGATCYLLYLPDGIHISGPLPFGSYHAPFPSPAGTIGDGWAVVSRAKPYGGGETRLQQLTRDASHEVIEAATDPTWNSWSLDPVPSSPWSGSVWQVFQIPGPIETADLCEGSRLVEANGDEYQRYFSNQAAARGGDPCVPPQAETYYNVTANQDWYPIAAGQTIEVPMTGWSAASTPDWLTLAVVVGATGGWASLDGKQLPVTSPLGQENAPCTGEGLNDGVTATTTVQAPAGAQSGDFAVIQLESFRVDPKTCYPAPSGDQFHFWLFGVYVP